MSVIVKDLVVSYFEDLDILRGVSIRAEKSKITSIIGPNGAGKSTLLKAIYCFLKPRKGSITFDGEDVRGMAPYTLLKKGLCFLPQQRSVFPHLTVRENLEMGVWVLRRNRSIVEESISEIYERYPILRRREKVAASRLSGGEQRMLELARALAVDPKTILVDEPTAGLAPKIAEEIYRELEALRKEGLTLLLVDQNLKKAVTLSDYVYVLNQGFVELEGSREKFSKRLPKLIESWLV